MKSQNFQKQPPHNQSPISSASPSKMLLRSSGSLNVTFNNQDSREVIPSQFTQNSYDGIFSGMQFFLEVFENHISIQEQFIPMIIQNGGKIVKQLAKSTNYLIWQNGRVQSLLKAHQIKTVNMVTPLWLINSLDKNALLNPFDFLIPNIDSMLQEASSSSKRENQSWSKSNASKKRGLAMVKDESGSQQLKLKPTSKILKSQQHENKENLQVLDETIFEYDKDELDKTIIQIQEERYFNKEFAKDLRKFSKLQNQILNQSQLDQSRKDKRVKRNPNKDELIESYIEGDIELVDVLNQIESLKDKKKKDFKRNSNRKLSEMYRQQEEKEEEKKEQSSINKSAFVNYDDFIMDLDKEDTPQKINNHKRSSSKFPHNIHESHQQLLNQTRQTYLIFDKKLNLEQQNKLFDNNNSNQMRVTKSYTMNVKIQEPIITQKSTFTPKKIMNLDVRRCRSMPKFISPKLGKQLIDPNIEKENESININHKNKRSISVQKEGTKKKKQWQNILPKRDVPQRGCKANISYIEKDNDRQFEKLINGHIINF